MAYCILLSCNQWPACNICISNLFFFNLSIFHRIDIPQLASCIPCLGCFLWILCCYVIMNICSRVGSRGGNPSQVLHMWFRCAQWWWKVLYYNGYPILILQSHLRYHLASSAFFDLLIIPFLKNLLMEVLPLWCHSTVVARFPHWTLSSLKLGNVSVSVAWDFACTYHLGGDPRNANGWLSWTLCDTIMELRALCERW